MKLLSLFSGIGAFEKALDNLNIPYELVAYCDFDKYASKSYSAIHNVPESMNLGDITKVDEKALPKDIDLVTYGFPCQDISLAGKQKGLFNEDGTQTRSGLFFEALRIIEETQPRVAIAENVKNLTSKKFATQFQIVLESLEQAGYNNYWQVLNAKDYGIPQNRERVFIVSIRKDIDNGCFKFPEVFPLELRLKDMLEEEVDEKYYLTDKTITFQQSWHDTEKVMNVGNVNPSGKGQNGAVIDAEGLARTITQEKGEGQKILVRETIKEAKPIMAGFFKYPNSDKPHQSNTFYNPEGISPTLDTCTGGNRQVKILEPNVLTPKRTEYGKAIRKAYEAGEISESRHNMTEMVPRTDGIANTLTTVLKDNYVAEPFIVASRGRNPENPSDRTAGSPTVQRLEPNSQGICNTLTTVLKDNYVAEPQIQKICKINSSQDGVVVSVEGIAPTHTAGHGNAPKIVDSLRIRKLTPKECFRLQGFDDDSFHKAEAVNSNTQLYKQAGNSICVPVVEYITKALFDAGVFGGEPKPQELAEGQINFTDCASLIDT